MAMKILLADDSMTAQNMGKKILTDAGFEVIAVSNGAAALKKITAENPDIIILDVFMPGYTGLEVCERLKNNPDTSRKPVLLTVGKMEPFNPDDSNRVHAEGVMIKPFEATDLTAAVEAIAKRFNIQRTAAPPPPPPPAAAPPQKYRSYEETVQLSQDEFRQSLGITSETSPATEAASTGAVMSAAAVAVATPAMEIGVDSAAIVSEQEETNAEQPAHRLEVPAIELEEAPKTVEAEHSPFSHASVAREVVEHPAAPVLASEPRAAWDPVLDGIAIPNAVVTPEPETPESVTTQQVQEAQPMFGLEYAVPTSVAESHSVAQEEPETESVASAAPSVDEEPQVSSPNAYLSEASAAMELETSHALVEQEPLVESAPDFEPNVAPPVQVETHAETGVEPGIEQPSPELTVPPDPALVGGTESFSAFTTHFGVENPEVIPVGIVPELMDDAASAYEYQPPEEGHAFEEETQVAAESKSETEPPVVPAVMQGSHQVAWEMVPVEPRTEESALTTATPETPLSEAAPVAEPSIEEAASVHEISAPVEPEAVAEPVVAETVEAIAPVEPAVEATETPFDPDATQALPEEFFTSSEPQLETTAELVGASIPESAAEPFVEPAPEPVAAAEVEPPTAEVVAAPTIESNEPSFPEPSPAMAEPVAEDRPEESAAPVISPVASEPAILSVGPEPPSVEEPVVETTHVEQRTSFEVPAIAAAAAAGASILGATITEHLQHRASEKPAEEETSPGDQTQVFIASAVARVLDRMKPTLIEEIAREMASRRKPRKDPEE